MRYLNTDRFSWTRDPIPPKGDRPVCYGCHQTLKVNRYYDNWLDRQGPYQWTYDGYGYFCTLRCATRWANRQVKKLLNP